MMQGKDQTAPASTFPCLIHRCLSDIEELAKRDTDMLRLKSIIGWQQNGDSFKVFDNKKFEQMIMPVWFPRIKYSSFQRQLRMYGFVKVDGGESVSAYATYHMLRVL
jgi:HSF-type DNA-binding